MALGKDCVILQIPVESRGGVFAHSLFMPLFFVMSGKSCIFEKVFYPDIVDERTMMSFVVLVNVGTCCMLIDIRPRSLLITFEYGKEKVIYFAE